MPFREDVARLKFCHPAHSCFFPLADRSDRAPQRWEGAGTNLMIRLKGLRHKRRRCAAVDIMAAARGKVRSLTQRPSSEHRAGADHQPLASVIIYAGKDVENWSE